MKKPRKRFDLAQGTWRMRNGHTVEIRESKTLVYENPHREFVLWTGWCAACRHAISWLGFGGGRYSAGGKHPYDIIQCISLTTKNERQRREIPTEGHRKGGLQKVQAYGRRPAVAVS